MSFLEIDHLQKRFARTTAVEQVHLEVTRGEFVSFLGPSGCGKTTTLRIIAGFESPSSGAIRLDGVDITQRPPHQRNVGMVFQSYALFPNMTVAQNVGFGLKVAKKPAAEITQRVEEMLHLIKLPALGKILVDGQEVFASRGLERARTGDAVTVALRPEIVSLGEVAGNGNRMRGTVEDVNFLGSIVRIRVRFTDNAISLDTFNNPSLSLPQRGQALTVSFPREAVLALEAPPST